jgi:hypothetical protein
MLQNPNAGLQILCRLPNNFICLFTLRYASATPLLLILRVYILPSTHYHHKIFRHCRFITLQRKFLYLVEQRINGFTSNSACRCNVNIERQVQSHFKKNEERTEKGGPMLRRGPQLQRVGSQLDSKQAELHNTIRIQWNTNTWGGRARCYVGGYRPAGLELFQTYNHIRSCKSNRD